MKITKLSFTALLISSILCTSAYANNLALNGPGAGADGSSKANGISYGDVKDGNLQSYWQPSSNNNQRISVKWSNAISFNRVVLHEIGNNVTSWRLVNHDSGSQIASGTTIGNNRTIDFNTITAKKVNLEILTSSGAPRIAEFEVYLQQGGGTPGPNPQPEPEPGTGPVTSCSATPQGYASLAGGTTGGSGTNAVTVTVSTGAQLVDALKNRDLNRPLTVRVNGTITPANSGGVSKFDIKDMDNVSIIGNGNNAIFDGIGIKIWRANNVIIRNLTMRYVNTGDKDAITIDGPSRNIWIDHNDIYNSLDVHKDFYDELVSGKGDIDNITISYNKLHNSWKTSLWGSSDSDNHNRRITFHHNHWHNVNSRLPLFRFGQGHIYNNYYSNILETGINSRMGAVIRIENNVFEDTKNPIVSFYSNADGYWDTRGNQFTNVTWQASGDGIIAGPHVQPTAVLNLPYSFNLLPVNEVKTHVLANAGVNKCSF